MENVIIIMDGGVIQDVISSAPVNILVIDYDVEFGDEEEVINFPHDDGTTEEAILFSVSTHVNREWTEKTMKFYNDIER